MMWSQCTWDRNTLKHLLAAGPCSATTWLPNSRTPVPRSQTTYSSPPVMSSTQLVLPPKVPRTGDGSLRSMKSSIAASLSSACRRAATSASRILARTARSDSGAGSEPRVPRKWMRNGPVDWVPGPARLLDGGEDRHDVRKPADRKDLADDRVETGNGESPFLRLRPRGGHQRSQPGARYVFESRKIDD